MNQLNQLSESISEKFGQFDNTVQPYLSVLNNEYISAGLSVFFVLYAGLVAPKLPLSIANLFDNIFVKLILFFLIVYIAKHNPSVAIIAAVAVWVSMLTLSKYQAEEKLMNVSSYDGVSVSSCTCQSSDCSCLDNGRCNCADQTGSCKCHSNMDVNKLANIAETIAPLGKSIMSERPSSPSGVSYAISDEGEQGKNEKYAPINESNRPLANIPMEMEQVRKMMSEETDTVGTSTHCVKDNFRRDAHHQYKNDEVTANDNRNQEYSEF